MRLVVARCEVRYTGRLTATLPEAVRLLVIKSDGSVLVHDDTGGYKPLNWMTPPTVLEDEGDRIVVRKRAGKSEDRLEILIAEVLSDVTHDRGSLRHCRRTASNGTAGGAGRAAGLLGGGLHLVRREWPTDIGPVDLMCRDEEEEWVAVEIKRVGTIDAVEQLTRYLERIELEEAAVACSPPRRSSRRRGSSRSRAGIRCVEVDLAVLRGEREPELTLFAD